VKSADLLDPPINQAAGRDITMKRVALLCAFTTGCLAIVASFGVSARADDTLRVGKAMAVAFSFVPLDIGIAHGIFKKHGLNIEPSSFGGGARLQQALAAGGIDVALGSGPELAFIAKGAPQLGVAVLANEPRLLVLVVRKDAPIHSIEDLKGRPISVSTVGSSTFWLLRELSRRQGWGPDGIKTVPLGADPAQLAAMKTREVDGLIVDVGTAYQLEERGEGRIIVKFGDIIKDFHLHVIYASRELMAKNPDAVKRFLLGWFETIDFMRKNKAEAIKIAQPVVGVSPEIVGKIYDELMPMLSADGKFDPKALEVLRKSFVELGTLPQEPDMSELYTEKFLSAVR
jgi:NitT/TauT family transport system substrate-binding protein